jgi:hypothetical protein
MLAAPPAPLGAPPPLGAAPAGAPAPAEVSQVEDAAAFAEPADDGLEELLDPLEEHAASVSPRTTDAATTEPAFFRLRSTILFSSTTSRLPGVRDSRWR